MEFHPEDRKRNALFHLALLAALRQRPLLARGAGGVSSTQRLPAAATRNKAWRDNAQPGHADQDV
jgi:hypothetical protein